MQNIFDASSNRSRTRSPGMDIIIDLHQKNLSSNMFDDGSDKVLLCSSFDVEPETRNSSNFPQRT